MPYVFMEKDNNGMEAGLCILTPGCRCFRTRTRATLTNYNLGASAIYAISRDFNLMLETLAGWNEDIAEGVFAFVADKSYSGLTFKR